MLRVNDLRHIVTVAWPDSSLRPLPIFRCHFISSVPFYCPVTTVVRPLFDYSGLPGVAQRGCMHCFVFHDITGRPAGLLPACSTGLQSSALRCTDPLWLSCTPAARLACTVPVVCVWAPPGISPRRPWWTALRAGLARYQSQHFKC